MRYLAVVLLACACLLESTEAAPVGRNLLGKKGKKGSKPAATKADPKGYYANNKAAKRKRANANCDVLEGPGALFVYTQRCLCWPRGTTLQGSSINRSIIFQLGNTKYGHISSQSPQHCFTLAR
jgi:hypothetical protein